MHALGHRAYGPIGGREAGCAGGLNLEGRLRANMRVLGRAWRQSHCRHQVTVSVRSTNVERVVCESCGHVSVHFVSDLDSEVDRTSFARPGDQYPDSPPGKHKAED